MTRRQAVSLTFVSLVAVLTAGPVHAQPDLVIDIADLDDGDGVLLRVHGSNGTGQFGVPVAGGHDLDGDSLQDVAVGYMTADRPGITDSGVVNLIFGNGQIDGTLNTGVDDARILHILGAGLQEHAGSEIWIDDVTGDGLGDLLICRQDFALGNRCGAGALTIIAGDPDLRTRAAAFQDLDLASPPADIPVTTLVGAATGDRLCIWTRTGDVDGDGIADIVVGADQEDAPGQSNRGAVYVVRGGAHLATGDTYDLAGWGTTRHIQPKTTTSAVAAGAGGHPLDGRLIKIEPAGIATRHHLGGTVQIADLDGNGRGEVLFAAALNRAGAALRPATPVSCDGTVITESSGGTTDGTLYIAWDDNFPAAPNAWPAGYTLAIGDAPGTWTTIDGETFNREFGEEIVGGIDLDGDGNNELIVGDLVADGTASQNRPVSGLGHILFDAGSLAGRTFDMQNPPVDVTVTRILGPSTGAIGDDTAAIGDFDGDGRDDLALAAPHADPQGRDSAGAVHVLYGQVGPWPALIDLAPGAIPPASVVRITEVQGAIGTSASFATGDTLAYSASVGDLDDDGRTDLVINEMEGDGAGASPLDVGNLIVLSGRALDPTLLFADGFESGGTERWSP